MRRRSLSLLLGLSIAVSDAGAALACPSSRTDKSEVVGVDAEGNFVISYDQWRDQTGSSWSLVAYDAQGTELAVLGVDEEGLIRREGDYFPSPRAGAEPDPKAIRAKLVKAKRLHKPGTGPRIRHVKSEASCGSIEVQSKSGWVRVSDVDQLSGQYQDACTTVDVRAFDDPQVEVLFVRTRYSFGDVRVKDTLGGYEATDVIELLPKRRLRAAELALQGERRRIDGDVAGAIRKLERATRLAPELLVARSSLVRAYARTGRSWKDARARLEAPSPGDVWVGPAPNDSLLEALPSMWADAAPPEEGWVWAQWTQPRHSVL